MVQEIGKGALFRIPVQRAYLVAGRSMPMAMFFYSVVPRKGL
jgi:hypothetical protein